MFLNLLNKKESENFLELAYDAMEINGVIKESEEAIVETYRKETGLLDYQLKEKSLEELITSFQSSTKKVKRAVIIELAGVLDADEVVDEDEKKWIFKLGEDLGFREAEIRKMLRWVQDFNDLLQEGYEYINKK
ncbi:hypothetical protein [Ornithinibacillus scapharcae]|uniref:hypothetical protein n=1 Tax=Ornithinibacillus scapharcae TaxID=1147159 RepID=UPI000225B137|nr:hypothetical protein [Ornithinibacillus scapharcae]